MQYLDVVRKMDEVFGRRDRRHHAGTAGVVRFAETGKATHIVLDLAVGRRILVSKSFESFNYFAAGYARAAQSENPLARLRAFFEHGPIFLEGAAHRQIRDQFKRHLDEQGRRLQAYAPSIRAAMRKRAPRLPSALDFARALVEMCLAAMISDLSGTSLRSALRALRARRNVFYYHFHPSRHRQAERALAGLGSTAAGPSARGEVEELLCQSLIIMAFDPLIATICAHCEDPEATDIGASAERYCPVSFVARQCVESVTVGSTECGPGDIVYVALVPGRDADGSRTFPFGAGIHTCVGQQLSMQILRLAEDIRRTEFAGGFANRAVLSPDGAFMSFSNA